MKYINKRITIKSSMIKNYYWALAIATAFVAGTIATATPVFAPPPEDDDDGEGGWKAAVAEQQAQIDELKANEILGFYEVVGDIEITLPNGANIFCDEGDIVVGGGQTGGGTTSLALHSSEPIGDLIGWESITEPLREAEAVAVCADYAPAHEND